MYNSTATPPRIVKMGAPRTAAASTRAISGHRVTPSSTYAVSPSHSPMSTPAKAIARPTQPGDARQTNRRAITENATGSTNWATQTGTPAASMVPSSLSNSTSW